LERRWDEALAAVEALLARTAEFDERVAKDLSQLLVESWTPPTTFSGAVRFGTFELDLRRIAETVLARAPSSLDPARPAVVPALLEFPDRCAVLLQSERQGRQQAIETLRAVMVRLFTSLPPGEVRFTILDPVGLGESFAGFMHAGDYQEALIGGRIWTETIQIQQQLEDLTQHMENVIQKYLRNEFETLEEYNQQAGELAEPYHFLVVADFPTNFSEESARRLSSIVHSGSRCGVYTLIEYDTRREMPQGIDLNDIVANSIHLVYADGRQGRCRIGPGGGPLRRGRSQRRAVLVARQPRGTVRSARPRRRHPAPVSAPGPGRRPAFADRWKDRLRKIHPAPCDGHQSCFMVCPR